MLIPVDKKDNQRFSASGLALKTSPPTEDYFRGELVFLLDLRLTGCKCIITWAANAHVARSITHQLIVAAAADNTICTTAPSDPFGI
jgi:hypothetical protein